MDFAPPPSPGTRIQELGDRLVVTFRPDRLLGQVLFVGVWLAGWTAAGVATILALPNEDWSTRAGLLIGLVLWAAGEAVVTVFLAWLLFGRELLIVTSCQLYVRREVGRFGWTKRYDRTLAGDICAARVPSDEEGAPRADFGLLISFGAAEIHVGQGMGESEAEYVAEVVRARVHPSSWWPRSVASTGDWAAPSARSERTALVVGAACVVAVPLVAAAIAIVAHDEPSARPVAGYSDPRSYAVALTRSMASGTGWNVVSPVTCDEPLTWAAWRCHVTVQVPVGRPSDRRMMSQRCDSAVEDARPVMLCTPVGGQFRPLRSAPRGVAQPG